MLELPSYAVVSGVAKVQLYFDKVYTDPVAENLKLLAGSLTVLNAEVSSNV